MVLRELINWRISHPAWWIRNPIQSFEDLYQCLYSQFLRDKVNGLDKDKVYLNWEHSSFTGGDPITLYGPLELKASKRHRIADVYRAIC